MLAADGGGAVADSLVASHDSTESRTACYSSIHSGEPASSVHSETRRATRSLVFIDSEVKDSQFLADAVRDADVVLLADHIDPITQITRALASRCNVESIHIVSHGDVGKIQLGNEVLDESAIRSRKAEIGKWTLALDKHADILLYGCNTGSGEHGSGLMSAIAEITGADVAASINVTSSEPGRGDWLLEKAIGRIEAGIAFQGMVLANYRYDLPIADFSFDDFSGSSSSSIVTNGGATIEGGALQLTSDDEYQTGSAFFAEKLVLGTDASFQVAFSFEMIGGAGEAGADGLLFVLQNSSAGASALGRGGSGVGYDRIGNSIAIEFDTWRNGWDVFNDELGVVADGSIQNQLSQVASPYDLNSGEVYFAWIDYDGGNDELSLYISNSESKPSSAVLQTNIDVTQYTGDEFFAGFTSSNYNRPNAHRILSWNMSVEGGELPEPRPPEIGLEFGSVSVSEGDASAIVRVVRTGDASGVATVNFSTSDQDATSGNDYIARTGTVEFGVGETVREIELQILDDGEQEGNERFTVNIDNANGATLGRQSTAVIVVDDEVSLPFYSNFQDAEGIVTNGGASIENGVLQITSDAAFQTGSAFYDKAIDLATASFRAEFSFEITGGAGAGGADGLLFVLQNSAEGAEAIGRGGSGLGYDGIASSIAVELDTWRNRWDRFSDEVGVVANGSVANQLAQAQSPVDLNLGGVLHAWVEYEGASGELRVFVADAPVRPDSPTVTTNVDINQIVGDQAFVGFTASNYNRPNAHRVLSWSFSMDSPGGGDPGGGDPGGGDPGGGDPGGGDPGGGDPGGGDPGGGDPGGGDPRIGLQTSQVIVVENEGNAIVTLVRTGDSTQEATVNYQTFDQTAVSGEDYSPTVGTATFGVGESSIDILVPLVDDETSESTQTFTITIDNPSGATLSAPRTATITVLDDDTPLPTFLDFQDATGIVTNGDASVVDGALQITSDAAYQTGSAFFDTAVAVDEDTSFQSFFSFEMVGGAGAAGADGILFVLQDSFDGASAIGRGGSGVGYDGIDRSIAIELDTWRNSWDEYNDEVGVVLEGEIGNHAAQVRAPFNLNFGGVYYAWVDYNGNSDTLSVYLSESANKPVFATLKTNLKLDEFVGDQFYAGFTASNYNRPNAHRILSWSLRLDTPPADPPVNPSGDVVSTVVADQFFLPTAITWSPDGENLYVAEKNGVVKVVRDGETLDEPILDISDMVNSMSDRGLLDIAVHPDLANQPYMYLLYTHDPPEVWENTSHPNAGPDQRGNRAGQLMRITLDASTDFTTMVAESEEVILGKASTWDNFNGFVNSVFAISEPPAGQNEDGTYIQDFINSDSTTHSIGSLAFGVDGSLFVSIGDGASYNVVDPRAVRVQDIDSLSGKILRIDPITGQGLADNPFFSGDPDANRSKVYQLGLRNPFRIAVDDLTGELYIGDVGWTRWEEINVGAPGANFGWPYYEGGQGESFITGGGYGNLDAAQEFYESGEQVVSAAVALSHSADGINAIVMGDVLRNGNLGEQFEGDVFFNDLGQGIVRNATVNEQGVVTNMDVFATGAQYVVAIRQGPDGSLYFVDLLDGEIGRWEIV